MRLPLTLGLWHACVGMVAEAEQIINERMPSFVVAAAPAAKL